MNIHDLTRTHSVGHSLEDIKVQFKKDLKLDVSNITIDGKSGEILNVPRWIANVLESEKNVEIFYISNRYAEQLEATVNNLKRLGFPNSKESNVLLRGDTRSKSERRKSVSDNYEVIMLIGDNLSDFNDDFEEKISQERTNYTWV